MLEILWAYFYEKCELFNFINTLKCYFKKLYTYIYNYIIIMLYYYYIRIIILYYCCCYIILSLLYYVIILILYYYCYYIISILYYYIILLLFFHIIFFFQFYLILYCNIIIISYKPASFVRKTDYSNMKRVGRALQPRLAAFLEMVSL